MIGYKTTSMTTLHDRIKKYPDGYITPTSSLFLFKEATLIHCIFNIELKYTKHTSDT